VVFVFLSGGASHIDTFDPKPEASDFIRGDFGPLATAMLQAVARRLCEWMARQTELGADRPGADDQATRDLSAHEQPQFSQQRPRGGDQTPAIPVESIDLGPGLFGPKRAVDFVLNPALFCDLREAEQGLLELIKEFPLVSWERAEEG
jgi:hypothetical protein